MARVLIVNADTVFSMSLGFALTGRKHNVEVARSGIHGLEIGFQIHPDLTIVDWMLAGHLDGVQVAEALHAVLEETRSMVVTGFPHGALRAEATARGVSTILDKSMEMEELLRHADQALESEPPLVPLSLGYVQYDEKGRGRYASPGFRRMLGVVPDAGEGGIIERTFSYHTRLDLLRSRDEWIDLKKRDAPSADFVGFVRRAEDDSRSLLVLSKQNERLKEHRTVQTILGQTPPPPIPGRFLIIDENELQRRLARSQVEKSGGRCHAVDSMETAVKVLQADPEARMVLLDFRTAGDLGSAVRELTGIRPNVEIVGMCTAFRKREFEAAGVENFLVKPVMAAVLFRMLQIAAPAD